MFASVPIVSNIFSLNKKSSDIELIRGLDPFKKQFYEFFHLWEFIIDFHSYFHKPNNHIKGKLLEGISDIFGEDFVNLGQSG